MPTQARSQEEAERLLAACERRGSGGPAAASGRGRPAPASATATLSEFAAKYMAHAEARLSASTLRRYRSIVERVIAAFGPERLSDLTPERIQVYADARTREVAPASVRQELMFLSGLFTRAMRWGACGANPVRRVDLPPVENSVVRFLSAEEEARLLATAKEPLRPAIVVAIHTGLRETEQRLLRWEDVRFDRGEIIVATRSRNGTGSCR